MCAAASPLAEPVDRQIGGRLEQERPQVADGLGPIELQQLHVGLLGNLPRLILRADFCRHETQQRGIVLAKEPLDITRAGARVGGGERGFTVQRIDAHEFPDTPLDAGDSENDTRRRDASSRKDCREPTAFVIGRPILRARFGPAGYKVPSGTAPTRAPLA